MDSNWSASLADVLENEGGNDDDPNDRGGRTSRGITQREYDAWCMEHNQPIIDVWKAPQDHITTIYHDEYWAPESVWMPTPMDYIFFDMKVNHGPGRAVKLTQQALGKLVSYTVVADGRIGPVTRRAIKDVNLSQFIAAVTTARENYYNEIVTNRPSQREFLHGWMNRAVDVENNAKLMLRELPTS